MEPIGARMFSTSSSAVVVVDVAGATVAVVVDSPVEPKATPIASPVVSPRSVVEPGWVVAAANPTSLAKVLVFDVVVLVVLVLGV